MTSTTASSVAGPAARRARLDGRALALLLACCGIWGLGQVAAKVGLQAWPPLLQGGVRSIGAAVLLLAWCAARGERWNFRDGSLGGGLLAGALFAAEFGCIFAGLQFTTASRMAVFIYLAPFVVALGMPFISRDERLRPLQGAGLMLAFGGVVWAFAEGFAHPVAGSRQWLGDAFGLLAALLWGLTTLTLRATAVSRSPAAQALLYQLAVSGVALTVAGLWRGEAWPAAWPLLPNAALLFQIAIVSFASYLAWFWLLRHYPATQLSAFTLLTPVFGLVAGALLLGEPLTARLLVALAAIAAGLALVQRRAPR